MNDFRPMTTLLAYQIGTCPNTVQRFARSRAMHSNLLFESETTLFFDFWRNSNLFHGAKFLNYFDILSSSLAGCLEIRSSKKSPNSIAEIRASICLEPSSLEVKTVFEVSELQIVHGFLFQRTVFFNGFSKVRKNVCAVVQTSSNDGVQVVRHGRIIS